MERYRLTVDQAFRLLARARHTTNRKRRDIAEELTRQAPRSSRKRRDIAEEPPDRRPGPTGYSRQGQQLTAMPFICRTLSSIWCWVEGSCCSAAVLRVPRREAPDR